MHTGIAIVLAWPETFCKQPGSWYDNIMRIIGVSKHHYYQVGHAAIILIDVFNPECFYFDFGRYHAPYGYGRGRSKFTDDELKIYTKPVLSADRRKIENYEDILRELQSKKVFHGNGILYSSYTLISFNEALKKAQFLQKSSPLPYGPFVRKGSNCSRFVHNVLKTGVLTWIKRQQLKFLIPLTPTPINNVSFFPNKRKTPKFYKEEDFYPKPVQHPGILEKTLTPPERHSNVPVHAQWLAGEGAGSWFVLNPKHGKLEVIRYSPEGLIECKGFYANKYGWLPDNKKPVEVKYPSNCKTISLEFNRKKIEFERVKGL